MGRLTSEARTLSASDALAHLVTLNPDGSPQVSCVWVGLDGDDIVTAHQQRRLKVRNVQELAKVYLGPDVVFPPPQFQAPGFITRITPKKVGGVGPWAGGRS